MKFRSRSEGYIFTVEPIRNAVVDGVTVKTKGIHAKFVDGVYETDDENIIQKLKDDTFYGVDFVEVNDEV